MEQNQSYFRVNDLAPKGEFSIFFKRVPKTKSDGFVVVDNGEIFLIDGGGKNDKGALLYLLSALVLVICPLIWIFSQTMFFRKREPEFRTLGYIGIEMKKILGIHLVSGALIFVLGFVVNFAFSRLACFGIYKLLTALLPRLGVLGVSVSFDSFVPIEIMLICAAVSALCGTVASIIPFLVYKGKLKKEAASVIRTDE